MAFPCTWYQQQREAWESDTLTMQKHTMLVVKKAINFVNPGQTPVLEGDCPLYARQKLCHSYSQKRLGERQLMGTADLWHVSNSLLLGSHSKKLPSDILQFHSQSAPTELTEHIRVHWDDFSIFFRIWSCKLFSIGSSVFARYGSATYTSPRCPWQFHERSLCGPKKWQEV